MTTTERVRRKRLGQFFSGVPLARVLAALAGAKEARTIVDPMGGTGDMLEACLLEGAVPKRLAAIEIDEDVARACRARMIQLGVQATVVHGDTFNRRSWPQPELPWDIAITNPPYVRYQTGAASAAGGVPSALQVRRSLREWIASASWLEKRDREVFLRYCDSYSGLADLAVPAWLLCASSLAVGGRLAIVAPSTWLSREYAATVLHLVRRFFEIEYIVEDADGSWFSDALVRPTLVVAKRVHDKGSTHASSGHLRIRIPADAADRGSVVGGAFPDSGRPESAFAAWAAKLRTARRDGKAGSIHATWSDESDLRRLMSSTRTHLGGKAGVAGPESYSLPERMRDILCVIPELSSLSDVGWQVGQGLRTGANDFFYVTESQAGGLVSAILPGQSLQIPHNAARPAIRRQADIPKSALSPSSSRSRVLVLESWALPEDIARAEGPRPWERLDGSLARLVRVAARREHRGSQIPELSAVSTNIRRFDARRPDIPARFWYHLPPLQPRHRPSLYIPRINAGLPSARLNPKKALVIDANFVTLWPRRDDVTASTMVALLNSTWARCIFELTGTILGAGALKLEAAQLRRMLFPRLDRRSRFRLHVLGKKIVSTALSEDLLHEIDVALQDVLPTGARQAGLHTLLKSLTQTRAPGRAVPS